MKCVMENLLWLLLTLFMVSWMTEEVHSLPNYEIVLEKIEIDKKYDISQLLRVDYFHATRFNRSTRVVNGSWELLEDLPEEVKISCVFFEEMSNLRYSMIPMPLYDGTICSFLSADPYVYPGLVKLSNLPEKCPIKKAHYWINNYVFDHSILPDELPGKRWRGDFTFSHENKILAKCSAFYYIDRDIDV